MFIAINYFFLMFSPCAQPSSLQRISSHFHPGERPGHEWLQWWIQPLQLLLKVGLFSPQRLLQFSELDLLLCVTLTEVWKHQSNLNLLLRNPWIPGWILTTTLVLSVLVLIWICCATVATAVDQYVPSEASWMFTLTYFRECIVTVGKMLFF